MILLLLAACAPVAGPIGATDLPDTAAQAAILTDPAEAVDSDPDPAVVHVALTAAAWRYNGQSPGPTLRAKVGDTLIVDLQNDLGAPTTIHWHGVHTPYAMDGAGWQVAPVPPGGAFTYRFTLDHPGTFWYHPHFDTEGQVDRGLYGALIVEDPAEPKADVDAVWVFDIPGEAPAEGTTDTDGDGHGEGGGEHGFAFPPAPWTVNGLTLPTARLPGGAVVRARLINVANVGYLALSWPGMRVIGGGQGMLAAAVTEGPLVLAPGQRAEVELLPAEQAFDMVSTPWSLAGPSAIGEPMAVLRIEPEPAPAAAPIAWPFSGATPTPDPGHTDVVWSLSGDVHTGQWLINGASWPDIGFTRVPLGSAFIAEVRNLSPTAHPFHLHGMAFEVLSIDGRAPPAQRIDDTIDVGVREALRIKVNADNPGDWMAHCHILPHAEQGMMTVLRVE